jgi:hypothetical protein
VCSARRELKNLSCVGHVEPDTKIVFHACKLDSDAHVTIRCSDTDILVIMLGNMNFIPNDLKISMHVGTGNHQRFIDINKLYQTLGPHLCSSLPGFHALTGCDFNPAFYLKRKKKPFQILRNSQTYTQTLNDISNLPNRNLDQLFATLEDYVCKMYGFKKINDINVAHSTTFTNAYGRNDNEHAFYLEKKIDGSMFPPCKSELHQHFLPTSYIAHL